MKKPKKKNKLKNGAKIWFWWGAGSLQVVTFVRWCKTKMNTGGEDTDKMGVGALTKSDWLYKARGGTRTQLVLAPYTSLYRTCRSAHLRRNEIKRPKVNEL